MPRWSELPAARVENELSKLGISLRDLFNDAEDVPELKARLDLLSSDEARRIAVLEYFGDQGHPQPKDRTPPLLFFGPPALYDDPTPDWGRLPALEEAEAKAGTRRGPSAKGYDGAEVEIAVRTLRPWDDPPGRNRAHFGSGLPTSAVDRILALMRNNKLAPGPRSGWLVIRGEIAATPPLIYLADLEAA